MIRAQITESRDIHHPDFILRHRPRATTQQLPYITRAEFMTPQSELIRKAAAAVTGENILCGGANSGKTMILMHKLYSMHCQIPDLLSVIIRKSKEDLRPSILNQWDRKVMPFDFNDPRNPCRGHGGEHNTSAYYWKNGGITFLMGAQDARRFKGTEFDVALLSQAEELAQSDFELIAHRIDGRAGNYILNGQKIGLVIADCNPDVANHWIPHIAKQGKCNLINVTLKDNMENFRDGKWTQHGLRVEENLKRTLSGAQLRRLLLGEWCNQAGAVFPEFDEKIHVIDTLPEDLYTSLDWDWIIGIDYGYNAPLVCLWCARHKVTRELIVVKEWRYTNMQIHEHVKVIEKESEGLDTGWQVGDHNPEMIEQFRNAGLWLKNAKKQDKRYSLDLIRRRLQLGLLKIYRHALISEDPVITQRRAPRDLIAELHDYRYRDPEDQNKGNSIWDDMPPDGDDDGIDALCYICREVEWDLIGYDEVKRKPREDIGITLGAVGRPEYLDNMGTLLWGRSLK